MTARRKKVRLGSALAALDAPAAADKFLREMLTAREYHDFMLRWELLSLLAEGMPQRKIAERLGVSLCKITRGARILKTKNSIVAKLLK